MSSATRDDEEFPWSRTRPRYYRVEDLRIRVREQTVLGRHGVQFQAELAEPSSNERAVIDAWNREEFERMLPHAVKMFAAAVRLRVAEAK